MKILNVDVSMERQILTGLIVSTNFVRLARPIVDVRLFDTSAVRLVAKWVLDYFDRYQSAPGEMLEGIYQEKSKGLKDSEAEWVEGFLGELSERYKMEGFNEHYLLDQMEGYFKRQRLYKTAEDVQELIENNRLEEAEERWSKGIIASTDQSDLGIDPFDDAVVRKLLRPESRFELRTGIRGFDNLAGPMKSEWLVMWMGPMKRGKTMFLTHQAVHSAWSGFNTVFISLEGGYSDNASRFWQNVGAIRYKDLNKKAVRWVRKFRKQAKGRLRLKSFPSYSAGVGEIRRYLDSLEAAEGFQPHVLLVDYLGAMSEPSGKHGRDVYDHNSKQLKGLSEERKMVVVSAHQGNKETLRKMNMHVTDVPEDVRILANVDALFGLNQTDDEREEGIIRLNVLMHRFRRFNRLKQVRVEQDLDRGIFHLSNKIIDAPREKQNKKGGSIKNEK